MEHSFISEQRENSVRQRPVIAEVMNLSVCFSQQLVLDNVSLHLLKDGITVLLGRSGSGKTTFLRALNRLNECFAGCVTQGEITLHLATGPLSLHSLSAAQLPALRQQIGMVFQHPHLLPVSIEHNLRQPLELLTNHSPTDITRIICETLQQVGLWKEVKDRLTRSAATLSGGQQQRLCLARTLALTPQLLLLDEPTASLDCESALAIEQLLQDLKHQCSIILVSHDIQQAIRLADHVVIFDEGHVTESLSGALLAERFSC